MQRGSRRLHQRAQGACAALIAALITAYAAASAGAVLISVGGIRVQELADALHSSPVQTRGKPDPALTAAEVRSLDGRINQRDPDRIRIAVVSPLSEQGTTDLTHALSDAINSDGVVIVVAGSNYHVTTTWGTGEEARSRLAEAVNQAGDSLPAQLRRAVDSFAAADAAAGHPGASSSEQTGPDQTTTQGGGATGATGATGAGSSPSKSSGSTGLIVGLAVLAVILVGAGIPLIRRWRGSMRTAHYRKEQAADVHAQAQADFVKLGEDIGALDIDSSMPAASAEGKDEYAKAIECYQDAERRLHDPDDDYQFQRARQALLDGAQHVQTAGRLFNSSHATATATAPSAVDGGVVDRLSKLAALHEQGALTDAEFAQEKRKLLGE
ncbi:MAG: SHOCT domain-containing protein [Solirubrobacteraceae bacterium]